MAEKLFGHFVDFTDMVGNLLGDLLHTRPDMRNHSQYLGQLEIMNFRVKRKLVQELFNRLMFEIYQELSLFSDMRIDDENSNPKSVTAQAVKLVQLSLYRSLNVLGSLLVISYCLGKVHCCF